jgi:hypothetical protein
LLKENHKITEEQGKSDCIHNGTVLHEQIVISEEDQQPSHASNDHVVDYMEGYFSSDLQPVLSYQPEKEDDLIKKSLLKDTFFLLSLMKIFNNISSKTKCSKVVFLPLRMM